MIPFVTRGGLGGGQSLDVNPVRVVNLIPQPESDDAKAPVVMYSVAGTQSFATMTSAGSDEYCRGLHTAADGSLWAVYGSKLYSVSQGGNAVVRYTFGNASTLMGSYCFVCN